MESISIYHYLSLGLFLFLAGILGSVLAKNVIKVLIAVELMLTGININFITFAAFCDNINWNGCVMGLFYTGTGAVELAIALCLFYLMFQRKESDNIEKYSEL